jgi:hypothetical protein
MPRAGAGQTIRECHVGHPPALGALPSAPWTADEPRPPAHRRADHLRTKGLAGIGGPTASRAFASNDAKHPLNRWSDRIWLIVAQVDHDAQHRVRGE